MTIVKSDNEFARLENEYGANNYHPLDVVIQRGEGVWVWDTDGNRYLDFLAAYSAVNQGHAHPSIRRVLIEQSERVTLTSRAFRTDQLGLLYKALHDLTGYEKMLPMNTGAEAVETAIKAARKWGYEVKGVPENKAEIIACTGNFHGRTIAVVAMSDEPQYQCGFGPYPAGFKLVQYGDAEALEKLITPQTAAFLVEPIQGEGGIVMPPAGYLKACQEICHRHNVLLIADEVMSGWYRTGKTFAMEHWNVVPDIMTTAKGASAAYTPLAITATSDKVAGFFDEALFCHGHTYAYHALATSAIPAAVSEYKKLYDSGAPQKTGEHLKQKLYELADKHICVGDVRGIGHFWALEIV
ncbi:MAG: aminotransferase class III-fold pyridoxal phosphate-dependent enzyme, partial [Gammaproteobacteria bacterium]|nr:aminotransferase class III-fold pyridoxal phosphate-dependent enzyme [Gammaproteobacteria bacterium]